jgi:hypothetical protein
MAAKKERPAPPRKTPSKAAAKTATTAAKPPAPKPAAESFGSQARVDISPDELRKLIAEAAYYRAKKRGFTPGYEVEDWVQAEAEVKERIGTSR